MGNRPNEEKKVIYNKSWKIKTLLIAQFYSKKIFVIKTTLDNLIRKEI